MENKQTKQLLDKILRIVGKIFLILFFYAFYKSSKYTRNQYHGHGHNSLFEFIIIKFMLLLVIIKDITKLFKYEENYKTLSDKYEEYKAVNPEKTVEVIKGIKLLTWLVYTTIFVCIIINIYEKY